MIDRQALARVGRAIGACVVGLAARGAGGCGGGKTGSQRRKAPCRVAGVVRMRRCLDYIPILPDGHMVTLVTERLHLQ